MKDPSYAIEQIILHPQLGLALLIAGALFTAAVGVSVFSFYIDDYWTDQAYRERLRWGPRRQSQ
ncbi:hypothetical protein [Prochlorococcus sp. MIT 1300]|uniref:hypothetical protein n=1 Tax=Prochlorococcus sp. MIT 1300 TaxID=3096218 RepID=UPI002A74A65A|nr:hypothetical protein [Prochlorococcus sp. MIT 1300]